MYVHLNMDIHVYICVHKPPEFSYSEKENEEGFFLYT
jgi:hypothetical protein